MVSTQIIPDESIVVLHTRTFGALEASDDSDSQALLDLIAVNDAAVIIEGPGRKDTLRFLGRGAYGGVLIPFKTGETYHLHVKSNSMGEVYATTEAKPKINFESVDADFFIMAIMIPWRNHVRLS